MISLSAKMLHVYQEVMKVEKSDLIIQFDMIVQSVKVHSGFQQYQSTGRLGKRYSTNYSTGICDHTWDILTLMSIRQGSLAQF